MNLRKLSQISIVLMTLVLFSAFAVGAKAPFDSSVEVPAIFIDTVEMEFEVRGATPVAFDPEAIAGLADVDSYVDIDNITLNAAESRIEIPVGQPVVFFLTNSGVGMPHDITFALPAEDISFGLEGSEPDVDFALSILEAYIEESVSEDNEVIYVPVALNPTNWVTFVPTEPGEYTFICSIPGHALMGMVGTIVVTE